MPDAILTLNAGSSSLKFALFWRAGKKFLSGAVEGIGTTPHFFVRDADGKPLHDQKFADGLDHEQLLSPLLAWIDSHLGDEKLIAAGHRIVHGGTKFAAPVQLNDAVLADLAELNDLAPLHEPHNLAAIRAVMALRPSLVQIGCFDTAFHHTLQPAACPCRATTLTKASDATASTAYPTNTFLSACIKTHQPSPPAVSSPPISATAPAPAP